MILCDVEMKVGVCGGGGGGGGGVRASVILSDVVGFLCDSCLVL